MSKVAPSRLTHARPAFWAAVIPIAAICLSLIFAMPVITHVQQAPKKTLLANPAVIPTSVVQWTEIELYNNQSAATSNPFNQEIFWPSSQFSQLEASSLDNIEFFLSDGTVIPSWMANNASNTATQTIIWLKLNTSIPADSSLVIYAGFGSQSTNFINGNSVGVSPLVPQAGSTTLPTGIVHYAPVTIYDNSTAAFPDPYEIFINFPSPKFKSYEAANLDNIEFFTASDAIIPSWIQGNASYNLVAQIWLRLPGLAGRSQTTVYVGFASTTTNLLNGVSVGAYPTYTSTYGQYDNGASVFNAYWNFAGTLLPSGLTTVGTGIKYTVSNGITVTTTSTSVGGAVISSSTYAYPLTLTANATSFTKTGGAPTFSVEESTSNTFVSGYVQDGYVASQTGSTSGAQFIEFGTTTSGSVLASTTWTTYPSLISINWSYTGGESAQYGFGSPQLLSSNTGVSIANYYLSITAAAGAYIPTAHIQWLYAATRLPPPFSVYVGGLDATPYGLNDNGATVFAAYWNFAGTSLPSGLISVGPGLKYTVDNGLVLTTTTTSTGGAIVSTSAYSYPLVLNAYLKSFTKTGGTPSFGVEESTSETYSNTYVDSGYAAAITGITSGSASLVAQSPSGASTAIGTTSPSPIPYNISIDWAATGTEAAVFGNAVISGTDSSLPVGNYHLDARVGAGAYIPTAHIQWLNAYYRPPDGIMPTAQVISSGAYPFSTILSDGLTYFSVQVTGVGTNTYSAPGQSSTVPAIVLTTSFTTSSAFSIEAWVTGYPISHGITVEVAQTYSGTQTSLTTSPSTLYAPASNTAGDQYDIYVWFVTDNVIAGNYTATVNIEIV